jgi:hypothetical protein
VELTPEERQRISEEEETRVEARIQIGNRQKGQLLQARTAGRPLAKRVAVFACLALTLLAVIAWRGSTCACQQRARRDGARSRRSYWNHTF